MKTIKRQILNGCFITIFAVILTAIFFNIVLLEKIYINNKQKELITFYEKLKQEDLTEEDMRDLSQESMVRNIKFFVTDKDFLPMYYSFEKTPNNGEEDYIEDIKNFDIDERISRDENSNPIKIEDEINKIEREIAPEDKFFQNTEIKNPKKDKRVLSEITKETDEYVILRTFDFSTNLNKLELRTKEGGNLNIVVYTSLDNIMTTLQTFNKISFIVLIIGVIVAVIMSIMLSRKVSKPIKKLSDISCKMAKLDFSEKYNLETKNEIDTLGRNFNFMSFKLEETINSLNETNKELEKDIKLLEQVDEKRREFITNVSHELKTPIAIIQGYGEAIHDGLAETKEDYEEYSEHIIEESKKMNKIVLQLIELMKSEEVEPVKENINLSEIANSVIASHKIENVKFNLSIKGNMEIYSDGFRIERALTNYVTNAICHSDKENKEINVSLEEKDDHIEVKVFNKGKNIPEESLDLLWDRFYKVDKARTRKFGGTGIGLSIVKSNIESLGGKVKVENKDNGVEFSFIVPKN